MNSVYKGQIVFYKVAPTDSNNMKHNNADVLPAIVLEVWTDQCVNLKVFTDGPGPDEWVTSVMFGPDPGQWQFQVEN